MTKIQTVSKYYIFVVVKLLRKIIYPISLVYAAVVHLRNYLFDIGVFKSKSFKTPIICIGNLSVGGTGKTPMVEFLIAMLQKDFKIGVLSRGYGRKSKGFILASPQTSVEELGDEPYQIYKKFEEVIVAVDSDRSNGINILEQAEKPDVILLDDAYQHRSVSPDFSLLLTPFDKLYCDDWYLPTGDLRDSKREAKRANLIVITKCPKILTQEQKIRIKNKLKPKVGQIILYSYLDYDGKIYGAGPSFDIATLRDSKKQITLVTGIARPKPLLQYLEESHVPFEHLVYNDHHFFTKGELQLLNSKAFVLTTEKDYVRLEGKVDNLHYIQVKHCFFDDGEQLVGEEIRQMLMKRDS